MTFIFEQMMMGGDRNFGYLIGDRGAHEAMLVDPSYRPELLVERAKIQSLKVTTVVNTHGHGDHSNGNRRVQELTGAKVAAYKGTNISFDIPLSDGQALSVGGIAVEILYVPGHSSDHIVVYLPQYQVALTGDHLFVGKIGGTWGESDAKEEYASLHRLMEELPETTTIWPGHDVGCRPSSTIALEKVSNPFLLVKDFSEFYQLKQRWATYKVELGLI